MDGSLNWPEGGMIRFGAVGFTQQLLAEPVEMASQHLSSAQRRVQVSGIGVDRRR